MVDEYYVLVLKDKTLFREIVSRETALLYLQTGGLISCKLVSVTDRENLEEIKKRQKMVEAFNKLGAILGINGD